MIKCAFLSLARTENEQFVFPADAPIGVADLEEMVKGNLHKEPEALSAIKALRVRRQSNPVFCPSTPSHSSDSGRSGPTPGASSHRPPFDQTRRVAESSYPEPHSPASRRDDWRQKDDSFSGSYSPAPNRWAETDTRKDPREAPLRKRSRSPSADRDYPTKRTKTEDSEASIVQELKKVLEMHKASPLSLALDDDRKLVSEVSNFIRLNLDMALQLNNLTRQYQAQVEQKVTTITTLLQRVQNRHEGGGGHSSQ